MRTTGTALRVLVVDDEPAVRGYMAVILQKQGCTVVEAENGADGYRLIEEQNGNFDLLLTDVRMPKMDGPRLAEHVRENFPSIPVIFVSAYAMDAPALRASNFLAKPFTPQALIARLQELSNRS